ncbi:hypothetical protein [Nocardioides sp.]|uniref:hypothetical protein n=1 Tax=Nocardioides sp. TaxID=35761 RepID=UPI00352833B7
MKLTKESAQLVDKHGLRRSGQSGLETGVIRGKKGQVKGFVEFARTPGASITNPAVLAGAAGIMAQVAMQQTMDEITDYLAAIDEKVDDVLRAQKDAVLAKMIGVGFVIEEAMTTREHGGRVNEVTWSKVQGAPGTIAETQAYALRQLDALAEKLEGKAKVGDLAKAAREAESTAQEWLAVLARCFQLQEAIAVIELDRVLDAAPDDLDGHRRGLQAARRDRLEVISRCTEHLLARMDAAAATANKQVLTHPSKSREVVASSNHVAGSVGEFRERLGIAADGQSWEARRWSEAAGEVRDKVLETGVEGVTAVRRAGAGGFERARSATGRVSERLGDRTFRRRSQESTADEADDEA